MNFIVLIVFHQFLLPQPKNRSRACAANLSHKYLHVSGEGWEYWTSYAVQQGKLTISAQRRQNQLIHVPIWLESEPAQQIPSYNNKCKPSAAGLQLKSVELLMELPTQELRDVICHMAVLPATQHK